jgi:hypothetical protein
LFLILSFSIGQLRVSRPHDEDVVQPWDPYIIIILFIFFKVFVLFIHLHLLIIIKYTSIYTDYLLQKEITNISVFFSQARSLSFCPFNQELQRNNNVKWLACILFVLQFRSKRQEKHNATFQYFKRFNDVKEEIQFTVTIYTSKFLRFFLLFFKNGYGCKWTWETIQLDK